MAETTVSIPRLHPQQREVLDKATRYNVLCNGRRWGKSTLALYLLMQVVVKGGKVAWFNPNNNMLDDIWLFVTTRLEPLIKQRNSRNHRLVLKGGGIIDMWSFEAANNIRGRFYDLVIIDEAAKVPDLEYQWHTAIRATTVDLEADVWILSTPNGLNDFYKFYLLADTDEDWTSTTYDSYGNPHIPHKELDNIRRTTPAQFFAQEYLAQFVADGTGVFRFVSESATGYEEGPQPDTQYVIGVDWGSNHDFTVMVVMDIRVKRVVHVERSNKVDFSYQQEKLAKLVHLYKPTLVLAEENSIGIPILQELRKTTIPIQGFLTTNATKKQIIEELMLAFEHREITLLKDHPALTNECLAFTSSKLPSGKVSYHAPKGKDFHDDCVIALALAHHCCVRPRYPNQILDISPDEEIITWQVQLMR